MESPPSVSGRDEQAHLIFRLWSSILLLSLTEKQKRKQQKIALPLPISVRAGYVASVCTVQPRVTAHPIPQHLTQRLHSRFASVL
ncbi:hypothetical protein IF1G_10545 [Cordyceps javanica]|uniref:Uncharacterized protein n=1 Tax=Cordyceps javanica TaxID=43265 RepID=A0A545UMW3_9HYPO|nr:hypothetical protein IF1G_10545 [Cordyceps javanica]